MLRLEKPWEYGLSEEGCTDRFLQHGRLPAIYHPIKGEPVTIVPCSKKGRAC